MSEYLLISLTQFFWIGLLAVLGLHLIRKGAYLTAQNLRLKKLLEQGISLLEPTVAGMFILWFFGRLFPEKSPYSWVGPAILGLLFLWISRFFLEDYLQGIWLKMENPLQVNQWIEFNGLEGQIKKIGYRYLEIRLDDGKTVNVPYSRIVRGLLTKSDKSEVIRTHTFELAVEKSRSGIALMHQIRRIALTSPYASLVRDPLVQLKREEKGINIFEVTVFSMENEYLWEIEKTVIQQMTEKLKLK